MCTGTLWKGHLNEEEYGLQDKKLGPKEKAENVELAGKSDGRYTFRDKRFVLAVPSRSISELALTTWANLS